MQLQIQRFLDGELFFQWIYMFWQGFAARMTVIAGRRPPTATRIHTYIVPRTTLTTHLYLLV